MIKIAWKPDLGKQQQQAAELEGFVWKRKRRNDVGKHSLPDKGKKTPHQKTRRGNEMADEKRSLRALPNPPDANLKLDTLLAQNIRTQVYATLQSLEVVRNAFTQFGSLAARDAFETYPLGPTTVLGYAELDSALRVDGESVHVSSGDVRVGANLVVDGQRSTFTGDLDVGGDLRASESLFVASGAVEANSNAAVFSLPTLGGRVLEVASSGKFASGNELRVGQHVVAGASNLAGGVVTTGLNAPLGQVSAARLSATSVSTTALALADRVQSKNLDVRGGASSIAGPVSFPGSSITVSGLGASATVEAPLAVKGDLRQEFGSVAMLGSSVTLPAASLPLGAGLAVAGGPGISVGGVAGISAAANIVAGINLVAGGALDVAGTSRTSGAAQLRSAPLCQTRTTPASLGRTDVTSLVVREGGDLQVSDGRTILHGDLIAQGNVLLDGDAFEAHFQTYNFLGPNTDYADRWDAKITDVAWDVERDETHDVGRDVTWNVDRNETHVVGRDASWTVDRNETHQVNGDAQWQVDGDWNATVNGNTTWNTTTYTINYTGNEGLVVNNDGGGQDAIVVNNADVVSITNDTDGTTGYYVGGDRIITVRQPAITDLLPPIYAPNWKVPVPAPTPPSLALFTVVLNLRLAELWVKVQEIIDTMRQHGLIDPDSFPII